MASRHRSDITFDDLTMLARLVSALKKVPYRFYSPLYELGEYDMLLPLWVLTGNGWQVSHYREIRQEAIGIPRNAFIHVCRNYLKESPGRVLRVLFKFSMLSVVPGTKVGDEPQFRQPFYGVLLDDWEGGEKYVKAGFIIEKRRITGGFR